MNNLPPTLPPNNNNESTIQLCASCDRCRSRKTKCDGLRPCSNCKNRYVRVNKLSAEDAGKLNQIALSEFDCIYSPAKRRGPVPGKSSMFRNAARQNKSATAANAANNNQNGAMMNTMQSGYNNNVVNDGDLFGNNTAGLDHLSINNNGVGVENNGGFPSQQQWNGGTTNTANTTNINGDTGNGVDLNALFSQLNAQQQQQQLLNSGEGLNLNNNNGGNNNNDNTGDQMRQMLLLQQQLMLQQQQIQQQQLAQQLANSGLGNGSGGGGGGTANFMNAVNNTGGGGVGSNSSLQLLQQYQNRQQLPQTTNLNQIQQQQQQQQQGSNNQMNPMSVVSGQSDHLHRYDSSNNTSYHELPTQEEDMTRSAKRPANVPSFNNNNNVLPTIVSTHLPLLSPTNPSGTLLRQYFELSTNNLLNLPPIPSNEEYYTMIRGGMSYNNNNGSLENLPWYDQSALNAARFSQLALGALSNDQVGLALELSNACVLCLKNCVEEPNHKSCLSAVARAYLLHGILRSLRGDFVRYFKYRRVAMTQILMLDPEQDENVDALLAAISFHDAWAYMMYNAVEDALPDIDDVLPRISGNSGCGGGAAGSTQLLTDPVNQMWIQGEPRIFLKNEARVVDRSLDAISCAVRSCCDQANRDFAQMSQEMGGGSGGEMCMNTTPTTLAVLASENELCSRNMVLSAQTLVKQSSVHQQVNKPGLTMIITAMDAFLENSEPDGSSGGGGGSNEGGFSENQIRNLLSACEICIKHPLLLYSPGPVYHMMSNAAVLLCHLLNGLHAKCSSSDAVVGQEGSAGKNSESDMFYQVLDTFMSMRKLLDMHRQTLPVRLRCHAIPRPNIGPSKKEDPETPFIDLGETLMCSCRGCQGFVLMGCSPCVAAERSVRSAKVQALELEEDGDFQSEIDDLGDFNLDDDALFSILSRVANN